MIMTPQQDVPIIAVGMALRLRQSRRADGARAAALSCLVALIAGQSSAQDATDDWELTVRPEQRLTIASVAYSGGNAIGVRCLSGQLQVLITGLPTAASTFRPIAMRMDQISREVQPWTVRADHTTLSNNEPARFARLLRGSSHLELGLFADADVEGEGEPQQRLQFDLPAAHTSIDAVLTACGEQTIRPSDELVRVSGRGVVWTTTPRVNFPVKALENRIPTGNVSVRCLLVHPGSPEDCMVVNEMPTGAGFGREALRAARAATFGMPPVEAGQTRPIVFSMSFKSN